jgi:uncharacterized protein YgiM (DUF1202 family)
LPAKGFFRYFTLLLSRRKDIMAKAKFFWIPLCLVLLVGSAGVAANSAEMSVQVKTGELRATPSFLGKIVARLAYGDRVTVLETRSPWIHVQPVSAGSLSGWIHQSALTESRIALKAGAANVQQTASGDELALAGKGFNEQVEEAFKAKNPKVDFTWIDKMETFVATDDQMRLFLQQGHIEPAGGTQ